MSGTKPYPQEQRERAVRMVAEVRPNYESDWAAITAVAQRLGIGTAETLRKWVRQAQVDAGVWSGVGSEESAEVKRLQRTPALLEEIATETSRGRASYAEVEESEADLDRFRTWLAKIAARDYFDAPGRAAADAAVTRCAEALAEFEAAALTAETGTDAGDAAEPTTGRTRLATVEGS